MTDPVPRQPSRRERSPAGGPADESAPAVTGWGQPPNRAPRGRRATRQGTLFPTLGSARCSADQSRRPPRGGRGGAPNGAPGRPSGPTQPAGAQRGRPPGALGRQEPECQGAALAS